MPVFVRPLRVFGLLPQRDAATAACESFFFGPGGLLCKGGGASRNGRAVAACFFSIQLRPSLRTSNLLSSLAFLRRLLPQHPHKPLQHRCTQHAHKPRQHRCNSCCYGLSWCENDAPQLRLSRHPSTRLRVSPDTRRPILAPFDLAATAAYSHSIGSSTPHGLGAATWYPTGLA